MCQNDINGVINFVVAGRFTALPEAKLTELLPEFKPLHNAKDPAKIAMQQQNHLSNWIADAPSRLHTASLTQLCIHCGVEDRQWLRLTKTDNKALIKFFAYVTAALKNVSYLCEVRWYGIDPKLVEKTLFFQLASAGALVRSEANEPIDYRFFYGAKHYTLDDLLYTSSNNSVSRDYVAAVLLNRLGETVKFEEASPVEEVELVTDCFVRSGVLLPLPVSRAVRMNMGV